MFPIPAKYEKHWALIIYKDLNLSNMSKMLGNTIKDKDHNVKHSINKLSQSKIEKYSILLCQVLNEEYQLKKQLCMKTTSVITRKNNH